MTQPANDSGRYEEIVAWIHNQNRRKDKRTLSLDAVVHDFLKNRNALVPSHLWGSDIGASALAEIDPALFAGVFEGIYAPTPSSMDMNRAVWQMDVAPAHIIVEDAISLGDEKFLFAPTKRRSAELVARAISGHARNGHGAFQRRTYPNTTPFDIMSVLGNRSVYDKEMLRNFPYKLSFFRDMPDESQKQINDVATFAEDFFTNPEKMYSSLRVDRRPLTGVSYDRRKFPVHMLEFLRGFYFAAAMDDGAVREKINHEYGVDYGYGDCCAVNVSRLKDLNIGISELADMQYEHSVLNELSAESRMAVFSSLGIIEDVPRFSDSDLEDMTWSEVAQKLPQLDDSTQNVYIRHKRGTGVADDLAVVFASFLPPTFTDASREFYESPQAVFSRNIGAFMGDRIDTIDKDSALVSSTGQDSLLAQYFNTQFKKACRSGRFRQLFNIFPGEHNLVSDSVVHQYVAASMITDAPIHSSQRYFLLAREFSGKRTCSLNEYLNKIEDFCDERGINYDSVQTPSSTRVVHRDHTVGFDRIPLFSVLETMNSRLQVLAPVPDKGQDYYPAIRGYSSQRKAAVRNMLAEEM